MKRDADKHREKAEPNPLHVKLPLFSERDGLSSVVYAIIENPRTRVLLAFNSKHSCMLSADDFLFPWTGSVFSKRTISVLMEMRSKEDSALDSIDNAVACAANVETRVGSHASYRRLRGSLAVGSIFPRERFKENDDGSSFRALAR